MQDASKVAQQAAGDIERFLWSHPATLSVVNVEGNDEFRKKDIDLIWRYINKGVFFERFVEIKGDRYYETGNYFFETISNESKNSPGCFLYTEAHYIFYYFIEKRELHILPMPETRDWFLPLLNIFRERKTSTPVGSGEAYVTVGRLVPRSKVKREVSNLKVFQI